MVVRYFRVCQNFSKEVGIQFLFFGYKSWCWDKKCYILSNDHFWLEVLFFLFQDKRLQLPKFFLYFLVAQRQSLSKCSPDDKNFCCRPKNNAPAPVVIFVFGEKFTPFVFKCLVPQPFFVMSLFLHYYRVTFF